MSAYDFTDFRLDFGPAPLVLGDDADASRLTLASDWLFRALQSAWRELFAEPLDASKPPFTIGSALPHVDGVALVPRPLNLNAATIGGADWLVRDALWAGEHSRIVVPDAQRISAAWRVTSRPRAAIDRISSRHARRFSQRECVFAPGCGMWIGARAIGDRAALDRLERALRYLGDCGIGGGRATGAGAFNVDRLEVAIPDDVATAAQAELLLSRATLTEADAANADALASPSAAIAFTSAVVPTKPGSPARDTDREAVSITLLAEGCVWPLAGDKAKPVSIKGGAVAINGAADGLADADAAQRYAYAFTLPLGRPFFADADWLRAEHFPKSQPIANITPSLPAPQPVAPATAPATAAPATAAPATAAPVTAVPTPPPGESEPAAKPAGEDAPPPSA